MGALAARTARVVSLRLNSEVRTRILGGVQPNRPKMATVVLSLILLVVGLALVFYQGPAVELVRGLLPGDLQRQVVSLMAERFVAWAALAASPLLLIVGSLVRGL